jgi:hypothetical protein
MSTPYAATFWQRQDNSIKIGKLRKTITIPAFSDIPCGFNIASNHSLAYLTSAVGSTALGTKWDFPSYGDFTLEGWFKFKSFTSYSQLFDCGSHHLQVTTDANCRLCIVVDEYQAGVGPIGQNTYASQEPLHGSQWVHIALTYEVATKTLRLYKNEVLILEQVIAGLYPSSFTVGINDIWQSVFVGGFFQGYISQFKAWSKCLNQEQLTYYANKWHGVVGVEGLVSFIRLNDTDTTINTATDLVDEEVWILQTTPTWETFTQDVAPKLGFGASFVAARFAVDAGSSISLKFPVKKPYKTVNFALCISWTDDDDNFHRAYLWRHADIFISQVQDYSGERLPATFTLECWNVDGNETIDLDEPVVLELSKKTLPQSSIDRTAINTNLTINTLLACPFEAIIGLRFPLVFNTQQTYIEISSTLLSDTLGDGISTALGDDTVGLS